MRKQKKKRESLSTGSASSATCAFEPTWQSLDQRPLPLWFDGAKFGTMLHWGVYSVPAFHQLSTSKAKKKGAIDNGSEWYWKRLKNTFLYGKATAEHHARTWGKHFDYRQFAPLFTADKWLPHEWASLFQQSGAKYVVLTSKHHEGFCLWPTETPSSAWHVGNVGPKRDLVGELAAAVRAQGLRFGVYYSLYEWFHPLYLSDKRKKAREQGQREFVEKVVRPQLKELVERYQPDIIWGDGHWERESSYWQSEEFLAWLFNCSPVKDSVVVNDRWGKGTDGVHGSFCNHADRFDPGTLLADKKWECCMTLSRGWGYNEQHSEEMGHWKSAAEVLAIMIRVIACNGNFLLNVGPRADGTIPEVEQRTLMEIGEWMSVNGEALFGTRPWLLQRDKIAEAWFTVKGKKAKRNEVKRQKLEETEGGKAQERKLNESKAEEKGKGKQDTEHEEQEEEEEPGEGEENEIEEDKEENAETVYCCVTEPKRYEKLRLASVCATSEEEKCSVQLIAGKKDYVPVEWVHCKEGGLLLMLPSKLRARLDDGSLPFVLRLCGFGAVSHK